MTAVKQLTGHINTLGHLVEHPPVNIRIHRHDVVRGRELLPSAVAVFAVGAVALTVGGRGGEEGRLLVGGDVIVLEVVVFVVD